MKRFVKRLRMGDGVGTGAGIGGRSVDVCY
jgi:hypothetical protein